MSTETLTETTNLEDLEFAPKCESVIYMVNGRKKTCDNPATHVLIFHTWNGCKVTTELDCAECVELTKRLRCKCGEPQYIQSMPIGNK